MTIGLPDGVYWILPDQRDWDGYYMMDPGTSHVFPVQVAPDEFTSFTFQHHRVEAQDYSIRCWFSERPFGPAIGFGETFDNFTLRRFARTIEVWDETLKEPGDDRLFQPSGKDFYLNVTNLQNSPNSYRLDISF